MLIEFSGHGGEGDQATLFRLRKARCCRSEQQRQASGVSGDAMLRGIVLIPHSRFFCSLLLTLIRKPLKLRVFEYNVHDLTVTLPHFGSPYISVDLHFICENH